MERLENLKVQVGIILFAQMITLIALYLVGFYQLAIVLTIFLAINIGLIAWIMFRFQNDKQKRDIDISRILGTDAKDALVFGEIGIITYDEQYTATWMNDFLEMRDISILGKKVTSWIPEISELFQGEADTIVSKHGEYIYEITRKENKQALYIKDITEYQTLSLNYQKEHVVVGLLHLDNYLEIQQYEDEAKMALINTNLRQPLVNWATKYGMFIRRLRSDRFLVVLNEDIFSQIVKDRFSILNEIRNAAEEIDVSITLSMSFARGTNDYHLMDTMVNDLLELAQSRGGDQVAVKRYGESVKYFGGNSEAKEKRSKVRVRVMAQAIKEAISEADRIFVIGHKEMDFDCMAAALCVSRICTSYQKESYIVSENEDVEAQLKEALYVYQEKLKDRHQFISDSEASKIIAKNDLIIMVDHHEPTISGAPETLAKGNKIIVIDHHRRGESFIDQPLLVYIESGASSSCELISELLPYQENKIDLSEEEATLMYLGILVDTNRFKMRTGSRTFEAAAYLRKIGVDTITAENMLKETFDEFETKTNILKYSEKYRGNIVISAVNDRHILTRTLMAQSADSLLNIKGMEASFIIAKTAEDMVNVSARSKGVINVQVIMEKMKGGGHFSAAALQREGAKVEEVCEELKRMIDQYFDEEGQKDEDNSDK